MLSVVENLTQPVLRFPYVDPQSFPQAMQKVPCITPGHFGVTAFAMVDTGLTKGGSIGWRCLWCRGQSTLP